MTDKITYLSLDINASVVDVQFHATTADIAAIVSIVFFWAFIVWMVRLGHE